MSSWYLESIPLFITIILSTETPFQSFNFNSMKVLMITKGKFSWGSHGPRWDLLVDSPSHLVWDVSIQVFVQPMTAGQRFLTAVDLITLIKISMKVMMLSAGFMCQIWK